MKLIFQAILPLIILGAGIAGFKLLAASAPEKQSRQSEKVVVEVDVVTLSPETHSPPVRSFGTVTPYFETTLTPQVTARVVEVSPDFRVGHLIKEGTVLVRLEKTDFIASLSTQESALTTAERSYAEESIRAEQAAADWEASGRKLNTASPFVLREPQLAAAKGSITSAKAAIDRARADLDRTEIIAPYDAIVTERSAALGNLATPQSSLGAIIATERAELFLPLTAEQSRRILLPTSTAVGASLSLTSPTQPAAKWTASLTRISPTISRDQAITVIAEIQNPYEGEFPLPMGTFVNALIDSQPLAESLSLPESALVNDSFIWLVTAEKELVQTPVTRLQSDAGNVFVTVQREELKPPFTVVTRPLTNFSNGQKVAPAQ